MTALELAADVGLLAVVLATANICLGLLITVRYSPWRLWPHRRINIFAIHTWTACFLMTSLLIHPVILLFSTRTHWRLLDLALPLWSPVPRPFGKPHPDFRSGLTAREPGVYTTPTSQTALDLKYRGRSRKTSLR